MLILALIPCICGLICALALLTGCGQTKDPEEIVGVYGLKQIEITFNDDTKKICDVDADNNDEMLKELSAIVKENLNCRYSVEKSENFVFRKQIYDAQSGNYRTDEATPATAEWDSDNDMFILKGASGAEWYYIRSSESGYYYVGSQFSINNTDFEVEALRGFMKDNDIHYLSIRYFLEK